MDNRFIFRRSIYALFDQLLSKCNEISCQSGLLDNNLIKIAKHTKLSDLYGFSASDPMTKHCPNLGRYEIVSLFRPPNADNVESVLAVDGEQNVANAAEVHDVRVPSTAVPSQCHHGSVRRLDIGCRTPDRMEFATSCSDEALSGKDYPICRTLLLFMNALF